MSTYTKQEQIAQAIAYMEKVKESGKPCGLCEDFHKAFTKQEEEDSETFIKWTEENFCDRDTCYFCDTKNNGDWVNGKEDAVCEDCGDKWKWNLDDEGYYKKEQTKEERG